jgi:hypothetical protein
MTKPLYFYNGTTFEQIGPTTPQSPIAYQTSAPTGPATGDLWIDSDGDVDTYNRQLTRYYFVATAAQTTITGTDANGLTLAYVAGSEAVYVNGALQVRGQDYTATNGTSVVMSSALAVNDVVEIFAYTAFTVANAYTKSETDGIAAAAAGLRMVVPTSVAVGSGSGSVDATGNVTFSGATSVSINGCFNSTYDNYLLIYKYTCTGSGSCRMRLRASGTDASGSNYNEMDVTTSTASGPTRQGTANGAEWNMVNGATSSINSLSLQFFDVNKALPTTVVGFGNRNTAEGYTYAKDHTVSTAYDGVTLYITGGPNITGTVRVYGYKD